MHYLLIMVILGSQISCGVDTGGKHEVEVSDSKQTVEVKTETELTKILKICEVEGNDGKLVPYRYWTDVQKECIELLQLPEVEFERN